MTTPKIDHRKRYIMVLDIETANFLDDAIAYDVGFAIADRKGNIYETRSLMIADLFFDYTDLLESAYYANKLPSYWTDFAKGVRSMVQLTTAKKIVAELMKKYNVTDVFAYNAYFDLNGLNRSIRYITKSKQRYFFPYGTKIHCIQHCACQTIFQQKGYFQFAIENNLLTKNGNLSTSAESAYRYICKDNDFTESHTGLEDVMIETAILAKCYQQHKKMDTSINRASWNLPQKSFQEFAKNT